MKKTNKKQQDLENNNQTPSQKKNKVKWGIIGTGGIARAFANGVAGSKACEVIAIASRTQEKADTFAKEFKIKKCYAGYEELLKDDEVEAVYIAIPHPFHAKWAIRTAEAGKHILCEKPITINHAQAMAVIEAARENDVFLMEAFMYRCHPQTHKLVELIKSNVIGTVQFISAIFSFRAGWNPEAR